MNTKELKFPAENYNMLIKKSDLYHKDYEWTAEANHDKPKSISGSDISELNRTGRK